MAETKKFGPYKGSKENGGRAIYVYKTKQADGTWKTTSKNKARADYEAKNGKRIDMFKPLVIIPIPDSVKLVKEIYTLPQGEPIIGQRLYLSGLDTWWFTTPVVSVE